MLPVLGPQNDIVTHRLALHHKDVDAAIETLRGKSGQPAVKPAFKFLVLTAARSGEIRLATWDEIDTAGWRGISRRFTEWVAQVLLPRRFRGSVSGPLPRLEEVRTPFRSALTSACSASRSSTAPSSPYPDDAHPAQHLDAVGPDR